MTIEVRPIVTMVEKRENKAFLICDACGCEEAHPYMFMPNDWSVYHRGMLSSHYCNDCTQKIKNFMEEMGK